MVRSAADLVHGSLLGLLSTPATAGLIGGDHGDPGGQLVDGLVPTVPCLDECVLQCVLSGRPVSGDQREGTDQPLRVLLHEACQLVRALFAGSRRGGDGVHILSTHTTPYRVDVRPTLVS